MKLHRVICPTCGKILLECEFNLPRYDYHDSSIIVRCLNCGDLFDITPIEYSQPTLIKKWGEEYC